MKKIFVLFFCFLMVSGFGRKPDAYILKGVINNCKSPEILIKAGSGSLSDADTVKLAADGSFTYSKPLDEASFGFVYVPDCAFFHLICVGGTESYLDADISNPGEYTITGDLDKEYEFYKKYSGAFNEEEMEGDDSGEVDEETGEEEARPARVYSTFKEMYDAFCARRDSQFTILETLKYRDYVELQKKEIEKNMESRFLSYYKILQHNGVRLNSDADYNAYMEQLDLDSVSDAVTYLHWKEICMNGEDSLSFPNMLKTAGVKITDPDLLEDVAMDILTSYFIAPDTEIDDVYNEASALIQDCDKMKWITDTYNAKKKTVPGSPAIECVLESPEGETISFSDLYGKVLYIDVWATWCGPCCAEIPYVEKLVEHFKNDDRIRFVSISIDTDKKAWLDKLSKDKPQWAQFLNTEFTDMYGITGIPCFIMIDRDGKIITTNAPRPSDPGLFEFVENNL